jgi:hypothetical protein
MVNKTTAIIVVLTVFLLAGNAAGGGLKQLRLTSDRGSPIGDDIDPWLTDSILVSGPFTLDITNHLPTGNPNPDADGVYLIIAANRDPRGAGGITVNIGPANFSDYSGDTIVQHIIPDSDWMQVSGNTGVDVLGYNTAPHGILTDGTWYTVQQIDPAGNNKFLKAGEENHLFVDFDISSPNPSDRIHIDSVGTRLGSDEVGFLGNPYSSDVTWQIPEFPTIALPVIAVIGLLFFFQHRKKKEE